MLLAALYVARAGEDEVEKARRGKVARRIFWLSTGFCVIFFAFLGDYLGGMLAEIALAVPRWSGESNRYGVTAFALVCGFAVCFSTAWFVVKGWDRQNNVLLKFLRLGALVTLWTAVLSPLAWLAIPLFWIGLPISFADAIVEPVYLVPNILMFASVLPAAFCWRSFLQSPSRRNIIKSLAAVLVGSILFFCAARYGQVGHYYTYQMVRGTWPTADSAIPYKTK